MLVLVTNRNDLTADWLVNELYRRGAEFVRFNTEDYPGKIELNWSLDGSELKIDGCVLDSRTVQAVWWRQPVPGVLPSDRTPAEAAWARGEAHVALQGFWQHINAHWVNRPYANYLAGNKPEQLLRARSHGFDVPSTIITNNPSDVRAFASAHEEIVCKALDDGQIPPSADDEAGRLMYTTSIAPSVLADLSLFGPEPYLFQALVRKLYDLRVTVIGDQVFGCRILSQEIGVSSIDWRLADSDVLQHEPISLEPDVSRACVALAHSYGLRFAAIDFACRPDGGYTFFELNPNGQWAWIEQLTGLPLAAALADELLTPVR